MKLSHKVGKIFSREAHTRGLRRIRRKLHPLSVGRILDQIDRAQLTEIQSRWSSSKVEAEKYKKYLAGFDRWMEVNAQRAQDLELHHSAPQDILDLGCGGGFFLFICKKLGHRCLGVDIGEDQLFDDLIDLFGVDRYIWKILPFQPLPDLGRKFDLITAFATGFNADLDGRGVWQVGEWDFFLNDLQKHLRPDGRVFFGINTGPDGRRYPKEVQNSFAERGAVLERNRVYFAHGCLARSR